MISNRGVKVWPGHAETFCSDHWRCRFRGDNGDSVVSHAQVISLLNRIAGAGFDFIKTEGLYTFDGERGFSLDQENKMAKKHGDKNKGQNNAESSLVAVIMGSQSDWDTMRHADETLEKFGVAHECRVISAHRSPSLAAEFVRPQGPLD